MVDKLIDTAMLFKAKFKNDELEGLMIEATSEDNWQTPTTILHKIANASYNQDDWKRIYEFIMDKLKGKKWKKVLKSLSLVEFILKNGSSTAVEDLKGELYLFKTFETFSCVADGVDRSEAIRQRAKAVVQMLVSSEMLEEERVKASNIKDKLGLSGSYSNAKYEGHMKTSGSSASSPYQGMGSEASYAAGSSRKQEPTAESYTDKIKTGFNQMSDYIKTSYNKVNWNNVTGYIKDSVTNPSSVDHRNTLLTDEPNLMKKTSTDSNKMSSDYKPPSGTTSGSGLFANLNVKKTANSTGAPKSPVVISSTQGNKPLLKPSTTPIANKQPATKPQSQQIDILSFDDDISPAGSKKQTNLENGDIFGGFDLPKKTNEAPKSVDINYFDDFQTAKPPPKTTNTDHFDIFGNQQPKQPVGAINPAGSSVATGNVFGEFNINMIASGSKQPSAPQSMISPAKTPNPVKAPAPTTSSQSSAWLSQAETNLIDFSDMSEETKPKQQPSQPQAQVPPQTQPMYYPMAQPMYPAPYPQAMGGYQPQPYGYPAQPPQMAIPANQYEQFQQFLLFQQQQQLAGLKGKN